VYLDFWKKQNKKQKHRRFIWRFKRKWIYLHRNMLLLSKLIFYENAYMAFLQIPKIKAAMAKRNSYLIVNDYHLAFW